MTDGEPDRSMRNERARVLSDLGRIVYTLHQRDRELFPERARGYGRKEMEACFEECERLIAAVGSQPEVFLEIWGGGE